MPKEEEKINVLFVCLGNICRSPLAEAVFIDIITKAGLRERFGKIDSCGTGNYHEGEEPDERSVALCRRKGIPIDSLARGVVPQDFRDFDYILGMDVNNVRNLKNMQPRSSRAVIKLFGEFDDNQPIADPYYFPTIPGNGPQGGRNGFELAYEQIVRYSHGFLRSLGLGQAAQL